jgi:hypothetical protein
MFEILEKIVKHLAKLDNYYVLRQEKEYIILGTKIIYEKPKEYKLTFSTYNFNNNVELPIFFVVTIKPLSEISEIDQFFVKNKFPMLSLHGKKITVTLESVRNLLDDFVRDNFKY